MDVFEALQEIHKETAVETVRRPLAPAERNNGPISTRRSRTREVSSRYKSPTPATWRCPSPNLTRIFNSSSLSSSLLSSSSSSSSSHLCTRRAISAERRIPSTPTSPVGSSTPLSDTSAAESQLLSKKITGSSRLPEVLWPSTMRSLSVSFQSDNVSVPVTSKKEKTVSSNPISDRTLKPSSNVASGIASRKSTPERKRSPLKGKNSNSNSNTNTNSSHQLENSRPVDGLQSRMIDQHRWPSRSGGGKLSSSMMTKSMDLSSSIRKTQSTPLSSSGISPRRLPSEGISRPLKSADDSMLRVSAMHKGDAFSMSERAPLGAPIVRSGSLPGSRMPSPSRVSSSSKGTSSPCRTRPSTPTPSRGTSPSRLRPSSPTRQSNSTTSVLSFIADIKKGKKINQLEEAHQLRLLYNRFLQWRFANARVDAAMYIQKITAEETLYNVWQANLELWDSVMKQRKDLQRLKLELKLNLVLRQQMAYLEDWALLEGDHIASLGGAIKDLEASTLRLPIIGGAKADIDSLKAAISSAVDMMQAMGSSIYSVQSKVEGINGLVSELAELTGQERSMLNECDALLASTAAMQVSEYSLQTQLVQSQQDLLRKTRHPLLWAT